jgi:hypothetical protein
VPLHTFDEILAWVEGDLASAKRWDDGTYPSGYPGDYGGTSSAWIGPDGVVYPLQGACHVDFVARLFRIKYAGYDSAYSEDIEAAYELMREEGWLALKNASVLRCKFDRYGEPDLNNPAGKSFVRILMAVIMRDPQWDPEFEITFYQDESYSAHPLVAADLIERFATKGDRERFWDTMLARRNPRRRAK